MSDYDGVRVNASTLVRGYDGALKRFREAVGGRYPDPAFFALFEALNWAVVLDEVIAETWRPERDREGLGWRGRVTGAEVMGGVRYVRNRVHHQWADALRLEEGARFPMRFPVRFFSWIWRDTEELPQPDKGRSDDQGHAAYETSLSGQRAEDTLLRLGDVFAHVGELLDPPRPRPV